MKPVRDVRLTVAALLAVLIAVLPAAVAGQPAAETTPPQATSAAPDVEADGEQAAPVTLGGERVIWVTTGIGPYTARWRADRISQRLRDVAHDRSLRDPAVTVMEVGGSSELRAGPHLLMVVTERDAKNLGISRAHVAQQHARDLETAIRAERLRYAPATLARSTIYGLVATLALAAAVWLIGRLTRSFHQGIERWRVRRLGSLRVQEMEIVSADRLSVATRRAVAVLRVVLIVLALDVYLTYVLGLFPWTRAASFALLDSVLTPVRTATSAFVGYLPKLLFVVVIAVLVYSAIRLVGFFFHQVRDGRLAFPNFPAEWADPTHKIVRVLLIAFGVVVAFPYLPASDSPAFTGVSVLMGLLISLASSSSLSNMIAGLVLTYTGAFRLGDRVKVGDTFGDIIETSLLATRIRTIKNEEVTIPNGIVLNSSVTNYSRAAKTHGLILHTSVTIGYDAPWRTVHHLLIEAALTTPGVLKEPPPFVWQTALNDFSVTYEINACTDSPRDMPDIYASLHARIQDTFCEAGVEIMSPHYTSLRDGNTVAIPEPFRGPEYRAPAFRVEDATSREAAAPNAGATPRSS